MNFKEFRLKRKLNEATSVAPTSVADGQKNAKLTDDKPKKKKGKDEEDDCEEVNENANPDVLKQAYIKTMKLEHVGHGYYKDPSNKVWIWLDSVCRFKQITEKNVLSNMKKADD